MLISEEYRALQRQFHVDRPDYGTSGQLYTAPVRAVAYQYRCKTVLDYGCGKSTLGTYVYHDFDFREYDPAIPGKDSPPEPADLVVCTDVLEHIEPDYLDDVIEELWLLKKKVCFVAVHTGPAIKVLPDGRNAHLIQRPLMWWLNQFDDVGFTLLQMQRQTNGFVAVMT